MKNDRSRRPRRLLFESLEDRQLLSTVPTHVQGLTLSADEQEQLDLGFLNATLYDGWNGHHVDGTPTVQESGDSTVWEDSTAALQKAIDDAYQNGLAAYIPAGNYQITDSLGAIQWSKLYGPPDGRSNVIAGDPDGATTLTLGTNANSKFDTLDSEGKPRPMLFFRHMTHPTQLSFEEIPLSHPDASIRYPGSDWVNLPTEADSDVTGAREKFSSAANILFHDELRNISFDLGGHSGATALFMPGAQNSSIHNISIDATGAHSGVWNLPGRNGGATNITVEGGQYGIWLTEGGMGDAITYNEAIFQPTIAGAKLYNQTVSAFYSDDQAPIVLVGFHITRNTPGPVITVPNASWSTAAGTLNLVDGIIEVSGGGTALQNNNGKNIYLRNVMVTGTNSLVQSGSQATVTGSGTWKRIAEYAYSDRNFESGDPPYEVGDGIFRSFSLIDGNVTSDAQPVVNIESNVAAPPSGFLDQHVWQTLPSYLGENDGTKVITDFGATADDNTDDRAAIQAAIDAASAAGHGRVFIPAGKFQIGGTLTLHANTQMLGAGRHLSWIRWHDSWRPTSGSAVMIQTVDDADATTFLGFLSIEVRVRGNIGFNPGNEFDQIADDYDRFTALHWRAGRNSMTVATEILRDYKTEQETNPHSLMHFTGNGGGRHFYLVPPDTDHSDKHPDYRKLLIEGTTEPLWFYGMNLEHAESNAEAEVRNAQNIRFYGIKNEGGGIFNQHTTDWGIIPSLLIKDSQNVALFGGAALREQISVHPDNPGAFVILGSSDNILISNIVPHVVRTLPPNGNAIIFEDLDGLPSAEIAWPDAVTLYKRGEIDDSVMVLVEPSNGDYDSDGDVDGSDFLAWQLGFGSNASPAGSGADGDASGVIDAQDLAIWQTNYPTAGNLAAASSFAQPVASTDDSSLPATPLASLATTIEEGSAKPSSPESFFLSLPQPENQPSVFAQLEDFYFAEQRLQDSTAQEQAFQQLSNESNSLHTLSEDLANSGPQDAIDAALLESDPLSIVFSSLGNA